MLLPLNNQHLLTCLKSSLLPALENPDTHPQGKLQGTACGLVSRVKSNTWQLALGSYFDREPLSSVPVFSVSLPKGRVST